jgi:hypothetical protein
MQQERAGETVAVFISAQVERYCESESQRALMTGLAASIDGIMRGLAQLGPGRVREGLQAFRRTDDGTWGTGFLAACDGQAGRLRERARAISVEGGHAGIEYGDVAEALKMDEATVRLISYCYDQHPAVLHALAYHYVALGRDALDLEVAISDRSRADSAVRQPA